MKRKHHSESGKHKPNNVEVGLHGTRVLDAFKIIQKGFTDRGNGVHFATVDDAGLAHTHGNSRAIGMGESRYAVIEAAVPRRPHHTDPEGLSLEYIELNRKKDVGKVAITGLSIYTTEISRPVAQFTAEDIAQLDVERVVDVVGRLGCQQLELALAA